MRFVRDQGFVIKRKNFGEADRIITIFSKDYGKINVVAKGVRKLTSRRSGLLEPFNLINFQAVQSYNMPILTEVELVEAFSDKKENVSFQKIFIICELLDALCSEDLTLRSLYDLLIDFAYKKESEVSFIEFKTALLVNLGFWNNDKQFATEDDSYRYIESIIERKLKSRTIIF